MADFDALIRDAAERYGVSPDALLAIARQESGLNPKAYNKETGASGLFQHIPATAKAYGIDPTDPEQSADAAAQMFSENLDRFGGDESKAIAAHFGGSDTSKWGPKTERYVKDVQARMPSAVAYRGSDTGEPAPALTRPGARTKAPKNNWIDLGFDDSPPPTDKTPGTLSNVGRVLASGFTQMAGSVGRGLELAGADEFGKSVQDYWREVTDKLIAGTSPETAKALSNPILNDDFSLGDTPIASAVWGIVQAGPAILATGGLGRAAVGTVFKGLEAVGAAKRLTGILETMGYAPEVAATAGTRAATAAGTGLAYGVPTGVIFGLQTGAAVEQKINAFSDEQAAQSPAFQAEYAKTSDKLPDQRRKEIALASVARKAADQATIWAMALNGVIGGGILGKWLHSSFEGGVARRMGTGVALEQAALQPMMLGNTLIENQAVRGANPDQSLTEGMPNTFAAGLTFAPFGAARGALHRRGAVEQPVEFNRQPPAPAGVEPPSGEGVQPVNPAQKPAENAEERAGTKSGKIPSGVDAETGEIIQPRAEGMLEGDIGKKTDGQPFKNRFAAEGALRALGLEDTHHVTSVRDGFVGRRNSAEAPPAGQETAQVEPAAVAGTETTSTVEPPLVAPSEEAIARMHKQAQRDIERQRVPTEPAPSKLPPQTEAQAEKPATKEQVIAGNAALDHRKLGPFDISLENRAGTVRRDLKHEPPEWERTMQADYGYAKGVSGFDKDELDFFIKPGTPENYDGPVYVVDQRKGNGQFDEHKIVAGYKSAYAAKRAYMAHYPDDWTGLKAITPTTMTELKAWADAGGAKKGPFAERGGSDANRKRTAETTSAKPAASDGGKPEAAAPTKPTHAQNDYYGTPGLRELAHGVRNGEPAAITEAAKRMAPRVFKGDVLVPMPGRSGRADAMLKLANAIAGLVPGVKVADVLRGKARESQYDAKKAGRTLSAEDLAMHVEGEVPDNALIIDSVHDTGRTLEAARKALPQARSIALAEVVRPAEPKARTAKQLARDEQLRRKALGSKIVHPHADSLITAIIKLGGLKESERQEIMGEKTKGNVRVPFVGALFSKKGVGIDVMAQDLAQDAYGYLTPKEIEDVDGGIAALREKIADELAGKPHYSTRYDFESAQQEFQHRFADDTLTPAEEHAAGVDNLAPATQEVARAVRDDLLDAVAEGPAVVHGDDWSKMTASERDAEMDRVFGEAESHEVEQGNGSEARETAASGADEGSRGGQALGEGKPGEDARPDFGLEQHTEEDLRDREAAVTSGTPDREIADRERDHFTLAPPEGAVTQRPENSPKNQQDLLSPSQRADWLAGKNVKIGEGISGSIEDRTVAQAKRDVADLVAEYGLTPGKTESIANHFYRTAPDGSFVSLRATTGGLQVAWSFRYGTSFGKNSVGHTETFGDRASAEKYLKERLDHLENKDAGSASVAEAAKTIEPAKPDFTIEPAPAGKGESIADFGEKIGGARKDVARPLGPRGTIAKEVDERPAWARKYVAMEELKRGAFPMRGEVPEKTGKWTINIVDRNGHATTASRSRFDSEAEALAAIPLAEVSRNHRVYPGRKEGDTWGIYRIIGDRKRALVKGGFDSEEAAMREMATNPVPIIEHKFTFPEKPWLDRIERVGPQRRKGDVSPKQFQDDFGFRAGEFGNWNMGSDGQAALNHAFDALHDLADTLGVPPKALSLNGELAIAFGARGHGGEGAAAAHYEPDKAVINLTKIRGAGSTAHEWFHALADYLKKSSSPESAAKVNKMLGYGGDVTYGFGVKSTARPELVAAVKHVMDTMMAKKEGVAIEEEGAKRGLSRAQENIKSVLDGLRRDMATKQTYGQKKDPATPAQLEKWDALVERALAGDRGADVHVPPPKGAGRWSMGYTSSEVVRGLNDIYKAVRGRSFDRADRDATGHRIYWGIKSVKDFNDRVAAAQSGAVEERKTGTEYLNEAKKIDGLRASDYWSTPHEMGARAFESYVFDKLAGAQKRSDYLVRGVENKYYALFDQKPYPEGTERTAINAAFDNLFKTIQSKETDKGRTLESRVPVWRSALAEAIPKAPFSKDGVIEAAQLGRWLEARTRDGTFKKDELEWSGLAEYLKLQGGKVSRAEIDAYLKNNGVKVEEQIHGGKAEEDEFQAAAQRLRDAGYEPWEDGMFWMLQDREGNDVDLTTLPPAVNADYNIIRRAGFGQEEQGGTKFANWQLPGGKNYRELLLTLPPSKTVTRETGHFWVHTRGEPAERGIFTTSREEAERTAADYARQYGPQEITPATATTPSSQDFRSSHFDQPNVLAHVRFNERVDANGKKVLFIEELQSDWAQRGRREGFKGGAEQSFNELKNKIEQKYGMSLIDLRRSSRSEEKMRDLDAIDQAYKEAQLEKHGSKVPAAPFIGKTEAWVALALKRMVRYAAENGFDRVAWTTGEQQAARYDLSTHLDRIEWVKEGDKFRVRSFTKDDPSAIFSGIPQVFDSTAKIADAYGKDVADRIERGQGEAPAKATRFNEGHRVLTGDNLKVGGEGMKSFYDKIVPNVANDVLKKLGGGRVASVDLPMPFHSVEGKNIRYAQAIEALQRGEPVALYNGVGEQPRVFTDYRELERAWNEASDSALLRIAKDTKASQPGFDITPALREKAMEGMPVFSQTAGAGPATRLDRDLYAWAAAGKGPTAILDEIAASSGNEFYRELAARFKALDVKPKVVVPGGEIPSRIEGGVRYVTRAQYESASDEVRLYTPAAAEQTIMHEFVHAATLHALEMNTAPGREMRLLYRDVLKSGKVDPEAYGLTSVDEFVAEGYSNHEFQAELAKIDVPDRRRGGMRKAWDALVDIARRILGISPERYTALDELLRVGDELMLRNAELVDAHEHGRGRIARMEVPEEPKRLGEIPGLGITRGDIVNWLHDQMRSDKTFNWWHKGPGTQLHKGKIEPLYDRVYKKARGFEEDTSQFAMDASDFSPKLLPRLGRFADVFRRGPKGEDLKAASDLVHKGTLDDKREYTREEARAAGATDAQWELYRENRGAITRSLDILAASEAHRLMRNEGMPREFSDLAKANPERAREIYLEALKPAVDKRAADLKAAQDARDKGLADFDAASAEALKGKKAVERAMLKREQAKTREDLVASIDAEVAKAEAKFDAIKNIEGQIIQIFDHNARLDKEGYAPLMRHGKYTVYMAGERRGEEANPFDESGAFAEPGAEPELRQPFFSKHESQAEANRMARALHEAYPDAEITQGIKADEAFKLYAGITPDTLELFARAVGAERSEIFQEFLKYAISDRSVLKRLIGRKGIAGFDTDMRRNLATFITSNAKAAARNYHFADMLEAAANIPKEKGDVLDEAVKLIEYMRNPPSEAHTLRSLMFMNYLGGSVAAALTNATQPIMQTLPFLAQYGGAAKAGAQLAKFAKIGAGGVITDPRLKEAMARADKDGITAPQEIHQLYAEAIRNVSSSLAYRKFARAWGSFFSLAEQFNRKITFAAAYDLAKDWAPADLAKAHAKTAYDFAVNAVEETQGVYTRANRPNWARGPVGSVLMTFKQFSIMYLEFLTRLPPQQKALAASVLVAASGVQGLPFAQDLEDLLDTIGQAMGYNTNTKQALRHLAVRTLGKDLGDIALRGVTAIPGSPIDMQVRLGLGNLVPGSATFKRSEKDKSRDIAEFFGPAGSVFQTALSMQDQVQAGNYGKALGGMAPLAIQNAMKGLDIWQSGQYKDAKGRKVIDATRADAVFKALGLQPYDVALSSVRTQGVRQDVAMAKVAQADILDQWAAGVADHNPQQVQAARQALKDWNERNPGSRLAINAGVVNARVRAMRLERDVRLGKQIPKAMRAAEMRELRGEAQ